MAGSEHGSTDDAGSAKTLRLGTAVETETARPITVKKVVTLGIVVDHSGATKAEPDVTTLGLEVEHVREIRYTSAVEDGVRHVEVVDGNGEHVASGMGEAADALEDLLLYLLPPDHPEYPSE